ncbi:unnamed protein product [Clonostachys rosea f. rosea IK726]|uniref:GPI mannosyltransferase 2 n=2 Tax=Bionectria ochroleuca TaxID=29856 RepID=A0A0B7JP92_BIOOC|nr:unnamed protein product [Clonostachys rosea f. rosea IK726]
MALVDPHARPVASLAVLFSAWKAFLLAIALAASAAPDYDTSTSLFFHNLYSGTTPVPVLARTLTRWDALYYVHAARLGGKLYEQEWAFSTALSALIAKLRHGLCSTGVCHDDSIVEPLLGILVSHVSHLISVVALYQLTSLLSRDRRFAFVASVLHIVSPAGLFLSSPYAEATFACLSFVASYLFALSYAQSDSSGRNVHVLSAGAVFGLATRFRSNGLANGSLFAVEALRCAYAFLQSPSLTSLLTIVSPVIGGLLVASGSIVPQARAWSIYCSPENGFDPRPWCSNTIPSIYSFVQEHYWNVGFLRYWTPNQIPLFLLAAPVLYLLIASGLKLVRDPSLVVSPGENPQFRVFVQVLAASQAFVAVLAITSYHVQIINRISSGYIPWYWWIARCLMDKQTQKFGWGVTVFMVMYAGIQGILYASFLPPA